MAHLALDDKNTIIAANTTVLFIRNATSSLINTFEIPAEVKNSKKVESDNENDEDVRSPAKNENQPSDGFNKIEHLSLSPNRQLLALTTSIDKLLYLYKYDSESATVELLSARNLTRVSSALRYSADSTQLLVAEKTGDCYLFDCVDAEKPGTWLLGHLSIVLDIMFTNDKRFILTCDRDEKIRLTNFPDTHLIEAYGLGHTEYVSSMDFLPTNADDVLVSVSGDKTLKLWQLPSCCEVFNYELTDGGFQIATKRIDDKNHVAVTHVDSSNLTILEITNEKDTYAIKTLQSLTFEDSKCIANLMFNCDGDLLVLGLTGTGHIHLYKLNSVTNYTRNHEFEDNSNKIIEKELQTIRSGSENSEFLFKKRFDNVQDYHERKKRRINEKNKRKVKC